VSDVDLRKLSITATRGLDIPGKIRFAEFGTGKRHPTTSQLAIHLVPEALSLQLISLCSGQVQTTPLSLVPSANGELS
jgi:hypothetical protein